ncbi:MAG: mannosyl transferase [Pedobacter sp.]|jgi:glycosyltransferase involved in cell wall biosynthesis|nr:mannosyl transferase [Pedobacter sp.]
MDNFTKMLFVGMQNKGHNVQIWQPKPIFSKLPFGLIGKKWMGYLDSFIIFPFVAKVRIRKCKRKTLFVFTDQALGPWVPLVSKKAHVIHCHDLLALQSAKGEIKENLTSWTGSYYQKFILWGYLAAKHFISVSINTEETLRTFLGDRAVTSQVVYNGLNPKFRPLDTMTARENLEKCIGISLKTGFLMHVGGNQWYKNRPGVIEIYNSWRHISIRKLPLLLFGESPSDDLKEVFEESEFKCDIHFIVDATDDLIHFAYAGASLLIFPSHAEGFGWPIAEAMACGCLVITSNVPPMTEVGGKSATYISLKPSNPSDVNKWAADSARVVDSIICMPKKESQTARSLALHNAKRFELDAAINQIEEIYLNITEQAR